MDKIFRTVLTAILILCCTANATAQQRRPRVSPKKQNVILQAQIDSLKQELEDYQSGRFAEDSIVSEMLSIYEENDNKVVEYSPELTDSLLSLWYHHRQVDMSEDVSEYDMDSVQFTSDVPDSVLIERLIKMNSYITLPFNETVKNYMILYSEKMPTKMRHILGLSNYYFPIIEETLNKYNLPEELKYMAVIESALNPIAVSRAGARGMWQFMHNTGKSYGLEINSFVDERYDVEKAVDAAARYLLDAYNVFGDWNLAISSYNCGAGNINKAIKRSGGKTDFWSIYPYLPRETRGYVPAFVGAMYAMTYHKEYGLMPDTIMMPAHTDTFEIHRNLNFQQISSVVGIPMDDLEHLNPQYTHDIIPGNEGTYVLKLPYLYTSAFLDNQDSLYVEQSPILLGNTTQAKTTTSSAGNSQDRITYKVKSGDYLGKIASKYGVSVNQLKSWNKLKSNNLRIGQTLYIYRSGRSAATVANSTGSTTSTNGYITYTVKSGDSLYKIAQRYPGVSAEEIMRFNNISSNIQPGKKIRIPTK